ncbi:CvpA family protein [Thermopirellula anaerolimosa]
MNTLPIATFDLIVLILVGFSMIRGAWRGFAWQAASLASLILGTVAALRFGARVGERLSAQAPWNQYLGMFVVFAASALLIWLLFRWVSSAIDRMKLKDFDRQLGAVFGAVKGLFLAGIVAFFGVTLSEGLRQVVLSSRSGPVLARLIERASAVLPPEVRRQIGGYLEDFQRERSMKQAWPDLDAGDFSWPDPADFSGAPQEILKGFRDDGSREIGAETETPGLPKR